MCHCLGRYCLGRSGVYLLLSLAIVQLSACSWRAPTAQQSSKTKPVEGGVAFSKVVLAQADAKGQLLWKFRAQGVTYGEGQQVARAKVLKGQLFEAGRPLFDIAAEGGTIRQTNQQVRLQGNIRVVDRQRKILFRGKEAQWNGQSGQLLVQNGLRVSHPSLQLWGDELQASKQGREVRVTGNAILETRASDSAQNGSRRVRLKTNQVLWKVDEQTLNTGSTGADNQPSVAIEQLGTVEKSTALAGTAQANLKNGLITLFSPVKIQVGSISLTSQILVWDTRAQKLIANELLRIEDSRNQLSILANRGTLEQSRNLVDLQGNVDVKGLRNHAQLTAEQLLWQTRTQRVEAIGNVSYVQASPNVTLHGPKAVGKMMDQTLRVSGGDVVTEIIP
jgi:lipopolysaccharide assembly outer membrane protein LptD (OstA)